jgi:hypothetical protein
MPENKKGLTLLRSEDWMAVWLGFLIIAAVVVGVRSPLPKFSWATDGEFAATATENKPVVEALIKEAEAKGETELVASATALKTALEGNDRKVIGDPSKKLAAAGKKAKDKGLQKKAADIDRVVGARAGAVVGTVFGGENIWNAIKIGIAFLILSGIGVMLMGGNVVNYTIGFPVVYILAWLSHVIAGNATMNYWGLEYVIFALIIGLFIGNVVGVPQWLMEAIKTEYYIKTGLVILGAGILFFERLPPAGRFRVISVMALGSRPSGGLPSCLHDSFLRLANKFISSATLERLKQLELFQSIEPLKKKLA